MLHRLLTTFLLFCTTASIFADVINGDLEVTGSLSVDELKTKSLGNTTGGGRWHKIAKIQKHNPATGHTAQFTGHLIAQSDRGFAGTEQYYAIFSFASRGGIRPLLTEFGEAANRTDNNRFEWRIYQDPADGFHYLWLFQSEYSDIATFTYAAVNCEEYWEAIDPPADYTLIWSSTQHAARQGMTTGSLTLTDGGIAFPSGSYLDSGDVDRLDDLGVLSYNSTEEALKIGDHSGLASLSLVGRGYNNLSSRILFEESSDYLNGAGMSIDYDSIENQLRFVSHRSQGSSEPQTLLSLDREARTVEADSLKTLSATSIQGVDIRPIMLRGGSYQTAQRKAFYNGDVINFQAFGSRSNRGLGLIVIDRATGNLESAVNYDVFAKPDEREALASAIMALDHTKIVALVSVEAWRRSSSLNQAIQYIGGSSSIAAYAGDPYRRSFALLGIPGIGQGNGIEVFNQENQTQPMGEIATMLMKFPGTDYTISGIEHNGVVFESEADDADSIYLNDTQIHTVSEYREWSNGAPPEVFTSLGIFNSYEVVHIRASAYGCGNGGAVEFILVPGYIGENGPERIRIYTYGDTEEWPHAADRYKFYFKYENPRSFYIGVQQHGGCYAAEDQTKTKHLEYTIIGKDFAPHRTDDDQASYTEIPVYRFLHDKEPLAATSLQAADGSYPDSLTVDTNGDISVARTLTIETPAGDIPMFGSN